MITYFQNHVKSKSCKREFSFRCTIFSKWQLIGLILQGYTYQQSPIPEETVHQQHETTTRNGSEDVRETLKTNEDDGSPRNGPRNNRTSNQKRNGPPNQGQGGYHQQQTYYQNNGYSNNTNRQRGSNRGGQRQGGGNRPVQHSQTKIKPTQHW